MSRFVRASKYRHVFGQPAKKDQCFDNVRVSRSAWDTNLIKVNPLFISLNLEASGGGAFTVIKHDNVGKLSESLPVFNGHTAAVLDTDFNPFNDHIVASAAEDCKVMIWNIPEGGLKESSNTPVVVLNNHQRKVGHVLFNPVADNVLLSSAADFTIKLWDISTGQEKVNLSGHQDTIQSLSWNWNGSEVVTSCRDKKIRIHDVRSGQTVQEVSGHQGVKGSRVITFGDTTKIGSTGFSRTSDRQLFVWDSRNFANPLKQENIDTMSGVLIPYFDNDTKMLFLAGKGDGNIRYFEWADDESALHYLSEYKSADPQRGIGFMPKRGVDVSNTEICKAFKVHTTLVEPISFRVPRKSDLFQEDIYPDCVSDQPAMTADEYFSGKTANPILKSLRGGFQPSEKKEFVSTAPVPSSPQINRGASFFGSSSTARPSTVNNDGQILALQKQVAELQVALESKDAIINQLRNEINQLKSQDNSGESEKLAEAYRLLDEQRALVASAQEQVMIAQQAAKDAQQHASVAVQAAAEVVKSQEVLNSSRSQEALQIQGQGSNEQINDDQEN